MLNNELATARRSPRNSPPRHRPPPSARISAPGIAALTLDYTSTSKSMASSDVVVTGYGNTLYVLDASNPGNPVEASSITLGSRTSDFWLQGTDLFVPQDSAISCYSLADPANPSLESTFALSGTVWTLCGSGASLYALLPNAVAVVDVSDIASPQLADELLISEAWLIAQRSWTDGTWLYLLDSTDGLVIAQVAF